MELAFKLGYDYKTHRNKDDIVKIYPFSSAVKSMSTIGKIDGENYIFSKGAPDFMIKHCSHFINIDGEESPIDEAFLKRLHEQISIFSGLTLRTLLLGYRKGGNEHDSQE